MDSVAARLEQNWRDHLIKDYPQLNSRDQQSVVQWLLGDDTQSWEHLSESELLIKEKGLVYRYQLLQRYLPVSSTQAYRNLIKRLSSVVAVRSKINSWIAQSQDRQGTVVGVIQELIQEIIKTDRYIQGQLDLISGMGCDRRLKDNLLFASLEEYCLRSIRRQPLLAYRFFNYLNYQSKQGITDVPRQELIKIVRDQVETEGGEKSVSIFDLQGLSDNLEQEQQQTQHRLRESVKEEFSRHLEENLGLEAVQWLELYLAGYTPEQIATSLGKEIKQIYRLREKINYHAVQVFAIKTQFDLIAQWLEISLKDHNLGLTPQQWQKYWGLLTTEQKQLIEELKQGKTQSEITEQLGWKKSQTTKVWSEIYLTAQKLRIDSLQN